MTAKKKAAIQVPHISELATAIAPPDTPYPGAMESQQMSPRVERFKPHEERLFEKATDLEHVINELHQNGYEVSITLRRETRGFDYPRIKIETALTRGIARDKYRE